MADYGASDTSTTTLGTNQFPISEVYVPNVGLTALEGGPSSTDGAGKRSAPVNVNVKNGNNNGQALMVNSSPVVLASDQTQLPTIANLFNGGGPALASGAPSLLTYDRPASLQSKNYQSGAITSTTAGDTNLTFTSAPVTIAPGMPLRLHTSGYSAVEQVYVLNTYVPSAVTTVIPLQNAVVHTGCIGAEWDSFQVDGPTAGQALHPAGIGMMVPVLQELNGNFYITGNMASDGSNLHNLTGVVLGLHNGSTADAMRGNLDNIVILASAARTTTQTSSDQTNFNGRGVIVTLDMTAVGTGSVTLEIDMKDPVSGKYVALLIGAAVVTNVTNIYTVYPGAPATANISANAPLPRTWRVKVTANNANTATYSVGASIIV